MENHYEFVESLIKKEADYIKKQIVGSTIYGQKINLDNINHLIVASFYAGSDKAHSRTLSAIKDVIKDVEKASRGEEDGES